MATLQHLSTKRYRPLSARVLVGRAPSCSLRLDDPHVSGEHATLIWTSGQWEIRDLGSRNGTFVDGRRLAPGEAHALALGVRIAFGHESDPWELADAGAPSAIAENLRTGELRPAVDGILALPSGEQPELVVYADGRGGWTLEVGEEENRRLAEDEVLQAGGSPWKILVPAQQEGTAAVDSGPSLDGIRLRFAVSLDEEHVELTVVHRGKEIKLEPREHGYTLLTLARARLEDQELPLAEQGWIDRNRLLKMLGTDANALNVAIYRARGQLSAAGVDGAAGIVEVRRGERRIGIDPERLEVVPL